MGKKEREGKGRVELRQVRNDADRTGDEDELKKSGCWGKEDERVDAFTVIGKERESKVRIDIEQLGKGDHALRMGDEDKVRS